MIAARLMLGQTQAELSETSGLSVRSIYNLEHASGYIESVEKLMHHFKTQGITFVEPNESQGWGVFNRNLVESFDDERRRVRAAREANRAAGNPKPKKFKTGKSSVADK